MSNNASILRIATAGSVDDGKSTLIGRLLLETGGVYQDQLEAVARVSKKRGLEFTDLSLITDGLSAEREQNITIDVAYRYLTLNGRKLIIADVPGHEQYTRNMVCGAATTDLAIILLDATKGMLPQTQNHLLITQTLLTPKTIIAINKMDEVGYDQSRFEKIVQDCKKIFPNAGFTHPPAYLPVSALSGDMVKARGNRLNWYQGPTLLELIESAQAPTALSPNPFRFPVQTVIRGVNRRFYAGMIAAGTTKIGQEIMVNSSRQKAKITAILLGQEKLEEAETGMSVALGLGREVDISRGDMLTDPGCPAEKSQKFQATLFWLDSLIKPGEGNFLLKHLHTTTRAQIKHIKAHRGPGLDIEPAGEYNTLYSATILTHTPLDFEKYSKNHTCGSFILIDEFTKNTIAAGLIVNNSPLNHEDESS